ncbi:F-box/LRR-repeat protein At3g26922-like isoform X1 [Rhodamnia argentea]|uniref:F-box/LRR-repeat protein At3g26922-like isoform X1 n=2 Tax=Rhodamnia argentea TaxID=178133 RepID=A0ABM3H812_9MYRT|nr:F-box/LRR-repeat protein At3g26922-like isoform X1 [Rhodamnia argentea]XP_048132737.1 F-box/LRR-repeat protein At3g26922-like isoform X1 [Rhodamnia argentea]
MDESTVNGKPKCQRLRKGKDAGIDKINRLPEAILEHILSFLPTVDAVKTSVLCKKWQYLWTSIPNVEFEEDSGSKRELFMNSVERVLLLRGCSHIRRFYIACNVFDDANRVNLWVSAAVQRNVEECSLCLSGIKGPFALPYCLFTSTSLTNLELYVAGALKLPSKIDLPNLKYLILTKIKFLDECSTEQLLSCPALQELFVEDCDWSHLRAVTIFTPMLKSLTIRDKDRHRVGCQVMICANNLESIYCKSAFVNDYCLRQSCSLMEAGIDVVEFPLSRSREAAYRISKLLQGMQSVKSLELSSKTIEVLTSADEIYIHLLVFGNLRRLNLGRLDLKCGAVWGLLHHSPHLEMLECHEMIGLTSDDIKNSSLLNPTPGCFASHLRQIKIDDFIASFEMIRVVKILLEHAVVLETLTICSTGNPAEPEMEKVFCEELLKLPRGSKGCQIILS